MSAQILKRQVEREVEVFRCDLCGVEDIADNVTGWMHSCLLTYDARRGIGAVPKSERHLCIKCTAIVVETLNTKVPPAPVAPNPALAFLLDPPVS